MKFVKNLALKLVQTENIPVEARSLYAAYYSAMLTSVVGLTSRIIMGADFRLIIIIAVIMLFMTVSVGIYRISRVYNIGIMIAILSVCYVLLPMIFFFLGGISASTASYFVLGNAIIFLLIRNRLIFIFTSIHIALICACYYINYMFPDHIAALGGSHEYLERMKYADAIQTIIVVSVFVCGIIIYQRTVYEKELQKTNEANRAKSDFLARMSHEIRTPMNAIAGMAELAMREGIPPAAQEYIYTVRQASHNLLSIINDILDFSKIESGKMEIAYEEYMPSAIINDVINIIKIKAFDSRLRFIVNISSGIPGVLAGDAAKIRQIMLNLLGNAVKYTEKGFISLTVSGERQSGGPVSLIIEVSDSGRGIRAGDTDKLFKEFTQLDVAYNTGIEGTGLGLAITKSFVTAMGGTIGVRSEYGKGSAFTVKVPQNIVNDNPIAAVTAPGGKNVLIYERRQLCKDSLIKTMEDLGVRYRIVSSPAEFYRNITYENYTHAFMASVLYDNVLKEYPKIAADTQIILIAELGETILHDNVNVLMTPIYCLPVAHFLNGSYGSYLGGLDRHSAAKFIAPEATVLLVDDIESNLVVTKGLLLPYKIQVDQCKSGAEAIEAIKAKKYDLVLMDHMMPNMDGIETTVYIRGLAGETNAHLKNIPIIAMTANALTGMRKLFLDKGFNDFLSKPIDIAMFNAILEKWIPKDKQILQVIGRRPYSADIMYAPITGQYGGAIAIDGLDTVKGLAMTGGDQQNYIKILNIFYQDGLDKKDKIMASLEEGDVLLFTTHVHALKNAFATIGAGSLSESAYKLEQAGRLKDLLYINAYINDFLNNLDILLGNISKALYTEGLRERGNPVGPGVLTGYLKDFGMALDNFDTANIQKISVVLQGVKYDAATENDINDILYKKLTGDYESAVAMINDLLVKLE